WLQSPLFLVQFSLTKVIKLDADNLTLRSHNVGHSPHQSRLSLRWPAQRLNPPLDDQQTMRQLYGHLKMFNHFLGEVYKARAETLKDAVKMMIRKLETPSSTLELIFHNFMDKTQNHEPHSLEDMTRLLNLYEASYHSFEDEGIPDDVRDFAAKHLKESQDKIDESMWWRNTKWATNLSFSPDSLVASFLWSVGFGYLPHYRIGRSSLAKCVTMITTIDDIYDVYATLDELEPLTNIIDRWDIHAIEELPDYMKIGFLGLYNTINEISYDMLTNTGILILPYLHKERELPRVAMARCAMWRTFVRYQYQFFTDSFFKELPYVLDKLARGDIPKSIQCYMHESGATEEEARKYIKEMIRDTWKKLNKERMCANSQYSREMAQFMYGEGDGHGRPDITKSHLSSLLFNPIQGIK
ncbi:hypothetical protein M8C21_023454, partial [Ambrosia artemisiifolia]